MVNGEPVTADRWIEGSRGALALLVSCVSLVWSMVIGVCGFSHFRVADVRTRPTFLNFLHLDDCIIVQQACDPVSVNLSCAEDPSCS